MSDLANQISQIILDVISLQGLVDIFCKASQLLFYFHQNHFEALFRNI